MLAMMQARYERYERDRLVDQVSRSTQSVLLTKLEFYRDGGVQEESGST